MKHVQIICHINIIFGLQKTFFINGVLLRRKSPGFCLTIFFQDNFHINAVYFFLRTYLQSKNKQQMRFNLKSLIAKKKYFI